MAPTAVVRVWHTPARPPSVPRITKLRPTYAGMASAPERNGASLIDVQLSAPQVGNMTLLQSRAAAPGDDWRGFRPDDPARHWQRHDRPVWPAPVDEHLVAGIDETDSSWLMAADVVLRSQLGPPPHTIVNVFECFPGCLVAALAVDGPPRGKTTLLRQSLDHRPGVAALVPDGKFIRPRVLPATASFRPSIQRSIGALIGTASWEAAWLEPLCAGAWWEEDLRHYASAIHTWLVTGQPLTALHHASITLGAAGHIAVAGVRVSMAGLDRKRTPMWKPREAGA